MARSLDSLFPGEEPVLLDGALGTALWAAGWPRERSTLEANLLAPAQVAAVHTAAVQAGAQVLLANSFAALAPGPLTGDERRRAAVAGVQLARDAAPAGLRVGASLSTSGLVESTGGAASGGATSGLVDTAPALLRALVEAGADFFVFETCNQPAEAQTALDLLDRAAAPVPAVLCATTTDGSRPDRRRVEEIAALVAPSEVLFGLNCCRGPHDALRQALDLPTLPRWLKPSTGLPDDPQDSNVMAAFARAARLRGVRFLGGCCGTGPDELELMAEALR
ncbi:MAG: homocysteine S-methyltransferase family protein [Planctomycetota bacterium]